MRFRKISKYPVGAKWMGKSKGGKFGYIWLAKKDKYSEMWYWKVCYSDSSCGECDWNLTYAMCREEIPLWNSDGSRIRFKRIE
jgi:hypothetical protein